MERASENPDISARKAKANDKIILLPVIPTEISGIRFCGSLLATVLSSLLLFSTPHPLLSLCLCLCLCLSPLPLFLHSRAHYSYRRLFSSKWNENGR